MDTAVRQLVLLRHAKSAWPDVSDHERPLAPRGQRDAPEAGRWLRESGYVPDQVLSSTARRTRETWQLVQRELGAEPPVTFHDVLYGAEVQDVLELVQATPDSVTRLLVVGHEPTMSETTLHLAGQGAGDALARVLTKFSTCAIAVLALPGAWAEVAEASGTLTEFRTPR